MREATLGDEVRVHYTGTLDNGATFDSSRERDPIDVAIGAGRLIEPFEKALVGMTVGDVKSVKIPPEEAYGLRHDAMVHTVAREQLPANIDLRVGMMLEATAQDGQPVQFRVAEFDDDRVTLDANHPLAGQTLNFEIELVEILEEDA